MRTILPHCGICGGRLRLFELVRNWRRGFTTYPQQGIDGEYREFLIRRVCRRCEERAAKLRLQRPQPDP